MKTTLHSKSEAMRAVGLTKPGFGTLIKMGLIPAPDTVIPKIGEFYSEAAWAKLVEGGKLIPMTQVGRKFGIREYTISYHVRHGLLKVRTLATPHRTYIREVDLPAVEKWAKAHKDKPRRDRGGRRFGVQDKSMYFMTAAKELLSAPMVEAIEGRGRELYAAAVAASADRAASA